MTKYIFALVSLLSAPAFAASTHECGSLDSIGNLVENTKSFPSVKVAYVSTEEPAAAPDHILVFVYDNEMGVTCTAISRDAEGRGFGSVNMRTLRSVGYNSSTGRLLSVQVTNPNFEDTSKGKVETIKFRANAQTGTVTLE